MNNKFFHEFSSLTKYEWIHQIELDLKGKDFEKTVISKSLDGFPIFPFYNAENAQMTEWLKTYQNQVNPKPELPGISPRNWSNVAEINVGNEKTANREILEVLQNGADGLILILVGNERFNILLENVQPQFIRIYLKPKVKPFDSLTAFFEWIEDHGFEKESIQGGLLWDYLLNGFEKGSKDGIVNELLGIFEIARPYTQFKVIGLDTAVYHNSGATAIQELVFGLSAFIEMMDLITAAGWSAEEIFDKLIIQTSIGADYFLEIAKLRVLRILIHQLAKLYQVDLDPAHIFIFSSTSFWTKTAVDVHSNMLRNTTEAMAAILGGCNALHVLPHDVALNLENGFSKRMALNVGSILKEESYFDKVLDPVAGSYYLEYLMDILFDSVKKKMIELESGGGWWRNVQSLKIQDEIKDSRESRMQALVDNKEVKIGANKFLNASEDGVDRIVPAQPESRNPFKPYRHSLKVESKSKIKHETKSE